MLPHCTPAGATEDVTSQVTWTSSDNTVADLRNFQAAINRHGSGHRNRFRRNIKG